MTPYICTILYIWRGAMKKIIQFIPPLNIAPYHSLFGHIHEPAPDFHTSVSNAAISLLTSQETPNLQNKCTICFWLDMLPNISNLSPETGCWNTRWMTRNWVSRLVPVYQTLVLGEHVHGLMTALFPYCTNNTHSNKTLLKKDLSSNQQFLPHWDFCAINS